jgi:hypothetical protein
MVVEREDFKKVGRGGGAVVVAASATLLTLFASRW